MGRIVFDQSSPVHPVSESRAGDHERDARRTKDKGRMPEILVSNLGYIDKIFSHVVMARFMD